jgi:hypothetical protein
MQAISAHWLVWLIGFIVSAVVWFGLECLRFVPLSTTERIILGVESIGDCCFCTALRIVFFILGITFLILLILALVVKAHWL